MVTDTKLKVDLREINRMAGEDPGELIRLSEERYRSQIRQVADRFCQNLAQNRQILLAGPSSSGKTTTSLNLQAELGRRGIRTLSVSLDDFFLDRSLAPVLPDGTQDLETPDLVDVNELESCLSILAQKGRHAFPLYDFSVGRRSERTKELTFDGHTAVIIEGLHALNPVICQRPYFQRAMKLYISIKTEYYLDGRRILSTRELRLLRRIIRDNNFRACPPPQTLEMWNNVVAGEEQYIRPFRTGADYWIDSLHLYEPLVYHPMLRVLLEPLRGGGPFGELAERLLSELAAVGEMPASGIPADSLLREFIALNPR